VSCSDGHPCLVVGTFDGAERSGKTSEDQSTRQQETLRRTARGPTAQHSCSRAPLSRAASLVQLRDTHVRHLTATKCRARARRVAAFALH